MLLSITIFGAIGGAIGSKLDHSSSLLDLGLWNIVFTTLGGFLGIWIAYKASQYMD